MTCLSVLYLLPVLCIIFTHKIPKMFDWFKNLFYPTISPDVTQSIVALLITIGLGVFIGKLRLKRVSLGVSAVMFVGIFMGHLGYTVNENISGFTRDLGLILFVYAIGIQVGPSFFSSFKREGIRFNLLSTMTVLFGGLITFVLYKIFNLEIENAVGLMSGSVTNTPGLGAAKASLQEILNLLTTRSYLYLILMTPEVMHSTADMPPNHLRKVLYLKIENKTLLYLQGRKTNMKAYS